ncbi:hypothetical protein [Anaerotalea alkaliphila]|uniref:Uncharacterized protein n=1 Tax=Anaerotalea alkaliphila TaxID=2662126 RepID=A0A7X5HWK5_9FIRM|nr:hypothetical protein [Anaerotalea alkaliphila]NDL67796.1 hypothetical protein [Anaerotalea alkaliphila]
MQKAPESTLQLLVLVAVSFVKNLPKTIARLGIKSVLIFLFIYLLNIYMVAEVNDGFGSQIPPGDPRYFLINQLSNRAGFAALSFVSMFVLSTALAQIKYKGIKGFLGGIATAPVWMGVSLQKSKIAFYTFFFGLGVFSVLGYFHVNTYLFLAVALGLFLVLAEKEEGMAQLTGRLLWSDFQRVFRRRKERVQANPHTIGVFFLAGIAAMLLLMLVPLGSRKLAGSLLPAFSLLVVVAVRFKLLTRKAAVWLFLFGLLNLVTYGLTGSVLADDGGKWEGGGTWRSWYNSPGAAEVRRSGVRPGLLGALGGLLSSAVSTVGYYGGIVVDGTIGTVKQVVGTTAHVVKRGVEEVAGAVKDTVVGAYELATDPDLNRDFWNNVYEDVTQMQESAEVFVGEVVDYTKDTLQGIKEVASDWDAVKTLVGGTIDDIGYGLETSIDYVSEGLTNAWNDPSGTWDSLVSGTGEAVDSVLNTADRIWTSFSDTMNDPEKVYQGIRDMTGINSFSSSWDPSRGGWERVGLSLLGTLQLYGSITTAKDIRAGLGNMKDDLVKWNADRQALNAAANAKQNMASNLSKNLGQKGAYIQTGYVDPKFMTPDARKALQQISREFDVQIHIRPGNIESRKWLELGKGVPKPCAIKTKTINNLDVLLGAPKRSEGVVGFFKPKLPANFKSLDAGTQKKLLQRFGQRMNEVSQYGDDMQRLVSSGQYKVKHGLVIDAKANRFVVGDIDIAHITRADGSPVSDAVARRVEDAMMGNRRSNVLHRSLSEWNGADPHFNPGAKTKMTEATRYGSEGVYTVNTDGTFTQGYLGHNQMRTYTPYNPKTTGTYGASQIIKQTAGANE